MVLALGAAAMTAFICPYDPITPEMQARLNPSLLDLAVAIIAGIAGAYTKSFKEILQSLAGVAIAVALVPPLAVAGIGLGRMDMFIFGSAHNKNWCDSSFKRCGQCSRQARLERYCHNYDYAIFTFEWL